MCARECVLHSVCGFFLSSSGYIVCVVSLSLAQATYLCKDGVPLP